MAGGGGEPPVARDEWRTNRLRESNVGSIVCAQIVAQFPDARQQRKVRIAAHGKIGQVGESGATEFVCDIAPRRITPNDMGDLHVDQMRCVQCFAYVMNSAL